MYEIKVKNKKIVVISLICALILTGGFYFARDIITGPFKTYVPPVGPIDRSDVSGSEFFNMLGDPTKGDAQGNLGQGKYSYATLAKTYTDIKTLALEIKTTTEVIQDGKVMDALNDKQDFKFARKYKFAIKSSENQIFSDGKNVTRYMPKVKTYATEPISDDFLTALVASSPALNTIGLLNGADYSGRIKDYKSVGKETVEGHPCDVIEITLDGQGQVPDFKQRLWLEEKTGIIIKNYYELTRVMPADEGKTTSITMKVTNLTTNYKINEPISDKVFRFVPSKDDRKYDPKKEAEEMARQAKLMEEQRKAFEAQEAQKAQGELAGQKLENLSPEERKKALEKAQKEFEKNNPVDKQTYGFKATGFSPSAFRGEKLVVVFWAYGAGEEYMETVSNFARNTKGKYKVITVNVNQQSQKLKNHVKDQKYNVPVYYLDEKDSLATIRKMQIVSLPATYFIDEIGVTRDVLYGIYPLGKLVTTAAMKLDKKEIEPSTLAVKDPKTEPSTPSVKDPKTTEPPATNPKEGPGDPKVEVNTNTESTQPKEEKQEKTEKQDQGDDDLEVEITENPKEEQK